MTSNLILVNVAFGNAIKDSVIINCDFEKTTDFNKIPFGAALRFIYCW